MPLSPFHGWRKRGPVSIQGQSQATACCQPGLPRAENGACKSGLNGNQPLSTTPPPPPQSPFHAVYSFEQIVSFTRHSRQTHVPVVRVIGPAGQRAVRTAAQPPRPALLSTAGTLSRLLPHCCLGHWREAQPRPHRFHPTPPLPQHPFTPPPTLQNLEPHTLGQATTLHPLGRGENRLREGR